MTKADTLRAERDKLAMDLVCDMRADSDGWAWWAANRIKAIDRELGTLARRRTYARSHRELLYDLNGHHGPA